MTGEVNETYLASGGAFISGENITLDFLLG